MRSFLLSIFTISLFACNNNTGSKAPMNAQNFTSIQWRDSVQDVGVLQDGATAQIRFHFKNTGEQPLLILSATPGCGCTVADYPKQPIEKGGEGDIVAAFDTKKGHPGHFTKSITVASNAKPNGNTILTFMGEIKSKDSSNAASATPVGN